MNEPTTPTNAPIPGAIPATSSTATAPVIRSQLGLEITNIGRGAKPGTVLGKRKADGGIRTYAISELRCDGGAREIMAEIDRVCAEDKAL